jgi:hypothetical protein
MRAEAGVVDVCCGCVLCTKNCSDAVLGLGERAVRESVARERAAGPDSKSRVECFECAAAAVAAHVGQSVFLLMLMYNTAVQDSCEVSLVAVMCFVFCCCWAT